jgi:GTP1/Obg family GTP-binding protein
MSKKTIHLDLPMHIGCFVYQYAKLRMLEFYYDFMDVFVDRRDFQTAIFEIEEPVSYSYERSLPAGKSLTRELVLFR